MVIVQEGYVQVIDYEIDPNTVVPQTGAALDGHRRLEFTTGLNRRPRSFRNLRVLGPMQPIVQWQNDNPDGHT